MKMIITMDALTLSLRKHLLKAVDDGNFGFH